MKNLNLINCSKDNLNEFLESLKENKIVLETGEYGFVLFNRLVMNSLNLEKYNIIRSDNAEELNQYIIYKNNNIEIRLNHNKDLDTRKDIDSNSGFPIRSSTLYYIEK